jgi:site-specific recombinase XerD
MLKEYLAKQAVRLKPNSLGHRIRFVRSFFHYAYEEMYLLQNPYRFRHPYACQLLDKGDSLDLIKGMSGYENASTTQVYAQLRGEHRRGLYRRFF